MPQRADHQLPSLSLHCCRCRRRCRRRCATTLPITSSSFTSIAPTITHPCKSPCPTTAAPHTASRTPPLPQLASSNAPPGKWYRSDQPEPIMRISISIVASDVPLSADLIPMDVFPDMTFNDIKALVEGEINVAPQSQHFFYNERPVTNTSQTLTEAGLGDGDLLGMAVRDPSAATRRRTRQAQDDVPSAGSQRQREGPDTERMRLHIIGDPRMMAQVRNQDPELADAAHNRDQFHAVWNQRQTQLAQAQADKEEQLAMLNADPFNVEAQAKIEEMIQQERIQENIQKALEDNPESFARVTMLYIDVLVNNNPVKAFVDSGAQTTIMSPSAAERCGITRLIDKRFGGIARGVGTARIIGRVHSAEIQIGQYSLASSFTVMEGKDVDLLLGLDMLKRHQMSVDLKQNCLVVQNDKVPFLPESEIPKSFEEALEDEPKISGPEGTQIGTRTGTVEQQNEAPVKNGSGESTSKPKINIHPTGSSKNIHTNPNASSASSASTAAPRPPPGSTFGFGQPQQITQESIDKITDLGFTREQAIRALQQVNGDVELAVGLLL